MAEERERSGRRPNGGGKDEAGAARGREEGSSVRTGPEVEARLYQSLPEGVVQCRLCPHQCRLRPGAVGICRTRRNVDGRLIYQFYGAVSSLALDPVEKKPLYHFHPGKTILSLGSVGCNLRCGFCQNWEIAQAVDAPTRLVSPEEVVQAALELAEEGCIGVAYTYNEPAVGFEFVVDTARLAREAGLANVMVTNGELGEEALRELLPLIDAWNVDVKAFTEERYRELCGGPLAPVQRTVKEAGQAGHVEVTNLLIPGRNDSEEEIAALVEWLAERVGPDTPLHFSRYFPRYRYQLPPTPLATLRRARELAERRLRYVYIGNVWEEERNDTRCPRCGEAVIERRGYSVRAHLDGTRCGYCGYRLPIVV